jgi:hypothetical protein
VGKEGEEGEEEQKANAGKETREGGYFEGCKEEEEPKEGEEDSEEEEEKREEKERKGDKQEDNISFEFPSSVLSLSLSLPLSNQPTN